MVTNMALSLIITIFVCQVIHVWPNVIKQNDNFKQTMGVEIETLQEGDRSTFPKKGQTATCHYVLTLTNGKKVDSSRDRGSPFEFKIGSGDVIKGWDEGVAKMSVGQRAKLTISPDMGYGAKGMPGAIPPNSTLVFDVELLGLR